MFVKIKLPVIAAALLTYNAFGAGLDLESENSTAPATVETVKNDTLDISGEFSAPKKKTQADRMRELRQQLEKQNEALVKKRIEQVRYLNEIEMNKKIQKAFEQAMKQVDQQI